MYLLYQFFFKKSRVSVTLVFWRVETVLPQIFIHLNYSPQITGFVVNRSLIISSRIHMSPGTFISSFSATIRTRTMNFIFRVLMEIIIILPIIFAMPTINFTRNSTFSSGFTNRYISIIRTDQITSSSLFSF